MKPVSDKWIERWLKCPDAADISGRNFKRFLRIYQEVRRAIRRHKADREFVGEEILNKALYRATLPEEEK